MQITYRIDKSILYIAIEGRVDASNSASIEEQIAVIKRDNPGNHTVIDAEKLEYISSAGLRVILKLRKEEPKIAIINASSSVYEIFDMTGFTDMITVEKAYQRMSIDGCEFIAKGACGAVYRYDDETIVKTYFSKDALPEIKQERENARRAFVLGINTAIPYGIVRIGDGYGTVTELLDSTSVSKLIIKNPEDISLAVKYYVDMLKSIHSVEADDGEFPDMKETALDWANFVAEYIPEKEGNKLRAMIEALPKRNTVLHGDYHANNILIQNGEPLLIDLDTLCMGHPIFELGSMYNACLGYADLDHQVTMDFFGYSYETSKKLWDMALAMYLGTDDAEQCRIVMEKAMVIGYTRMLRRIVRRQNEHERDAKIKHYQKTLVTLLNKVDSLDF